MTRIRLNTLTTVMLLCTTIASAGGQEPASVSGLPADPATAVISTADVTLFWLAFDEWQTQFHSAPEKLAGILERDYLSRASQGVQDFIPNRIISADAFAKRILEDPAYYRAVRANTLKLQTFVPEIRQGFMRLQAMYPAAVFPPVYFVIGRRNSGGTDTEHALIIGAEMFADSASRLHLSDVTSIVIHELIHYQQQTHIQDLTTSVMNEGAADFISELITGRDIDEDTKAYGDSHEQALWTAFQHDARTNSFAPWLYNGTATDRVGPPDLGYYLGYKVCQSLYEISTDKAAALQSIIAMQDPKAIIAQSQYAQRFH